jgi:hypothetical protein
MAFKTKVEQQPAPIYRGSYEIPQDGNKSKKTKVMLKKTHDTGHKGGVRRQA